MPTKRLQLLDYGRFFAALSVVAFHYTYNGIRNGKVFSVEHIDALAAFTKFGHYGVEFFFMISGFVIFYSSTNKKASEFARSRAIRLFPAFWIGLTFTSIATILIGAKSNMFVNLPQFLVNLTMIPSVFGFNNVDGVYWTLLWELKFYLLIFLFLLFGLKKLDVIFIVWPVYLLVGYVSAVDLPFAHDYYALFTAGALFAMIRDKFTYLKLVMLILSYALAVIPWHYANVQPEKWLIVGTFFLFFGALITEKGQRLDLFQSSLAGGLTYPLYLIHAHVGYMLLNAYANDANKYWVYPLIFAFVLSVSYAIHRFVERKMQPFWYTLFDNVVARPISYIEQMILILKSRLASASASE